jgi:hypothetical protein
MRQFLGPPLPHPFPKPNQVPAGRSTVSGSKWSIVKNHQNAALINVRSSEKWSDYRSASQTIGLPFDFQPGPGLLQGFDFLVSGVGVRQVQLVQSRERF